MPKSKLQKAVFALITVIITVHAYVFFSLYVINGATFSGVAGATGVIDGINKTGGVPAFGSLLPIWAIVLTEFAFAYALEMCIGQPLSFRLACKVFDPRKTHPALFETAVISATVAIMCPAMSFIAACVYYPYRYADFNLLTLLANWLKLVCFNFPFAYFTQVFFIQPFVRAAFGLIFNRKNKKPSQDRDSL